MGVLLLGATGCAALGTLSPSSAPAHMVVRQNAFDRQLAASEVERSTAHADRCERAAEEQRAALGSALEQARGASMRDGAPVPPSKLFAGVHAAGGKLSVETGRGALPEVRDSLPASAARRAGWMAGALRAQVTTFGVAYASARAVAFSCRPRVELAEALYMAHTSGWTDDEARERALMVRQIRAARAANVLAASAAGVLAAYEAAGGGHAEIADEALAALGDTLPLVAQVSDADVDAELAAVDEAVKARREAIARTGFDPNTGPAALDVGTTAATSAPAVPAGFGAPADTTAGGAAAASGVASSQAPDVAGVAADRAMALLPPAYRDVAQGVQAVANGDYRTAIKCVAQHVPGPLGAALKGALALFGS